MTIATTTPWRGLYTATALPFHDDLSVDYDAYAAHVQWLAANGTDGVCPSGSLGEYQTLTPEERARVVQVAVEAAPDGFGVMPGVDLESLGLPFERAAKQRLLDAGLSIMSAINEQARPRHPGRADISGCHHVYLKAPGSTAQHSRHAMAIHPGWFDRSPCGTGTSARMAQLHARGELDLHTDFVNESFIGSTFVGRLVEEIEVPAGHDGATMRAVVPTISGRAWVTGTAQYMLDPTDPFPAGFSL